MDSKSLAMVVAGTAVGALVGASLAYGVLGKKKCTPSSTRTSSSAEGIVSGGLSDRGEAFLHGPEWLSTCMECIKMATTHPSTAPDRLINMGVAENVLTQDVMRAEIARIRTETPLPEGAMNYYAFEGVLEIRQAFAAFLQKRVFNGVACNPDNICVANGCGPMLEVVASCITSPGDVILIPAPFYHAFSIDLCVRINCEIAPVQLKASGEYLDIDFDELAHTYAALKSQGKRVPMLLYTNPHNPSGVIFPRETTERLIKFCLDNKIHFVSDEIYALSILQSASTVHTFVSTYEIVASTPESFPDAEKYVHVLYGMSKDFGLNGMRVGMTLTSNQYLLRALRTVSMFFAIPADMQKTMARLLASDAFLDGFFRKNIANLTEAYERTVERLRAGGVTRIVRAEAGMFLYCNLFDRVGYTGPRTEEAERAVWVALLRSQKVFILPGFVFKDRTRGWFRICFTSQPLEDTLRAIDRVIEFLKGETGGL